MMRASLNAPEPEYEATATLVARFNKHVEGVRLSRIGSNERAHHVYMARGLHKLLADRAVLGDEEAGNVALGAPHWLTFNPTVRR